MSKKRRGRQEEGKKKAKEKARKRQECRMAPRKVAPRRSLLRGGKVIVPGAPGSPCERSRQGARRSQAEARNKGRKVHFESLTDICHLKNSELEPRDQKYKGRVVLRGDIVKDVSGSYAVFTEQGSSASQMKATKVMDYYIQTSRMFRSSSRCSIR